MMGENRILRLGLCALVGLAGLAFSGCGAPEETGTAPSAIQPSSEGPTPFQKELRLLKQRYGYSDAMEPAIVELVRRHGYPVPEAGDHGMGMAVQSGFPAPKIAGEIIYLPVKEYEGDVVTTTVKSVTVPNRHYLTVRTEGSTDAADPMIVIFSMSGSGSGRSTKTMDVEYDTLDGVESKAVARNFSGSDKTYYYAILAETYATRGQTNVSQTVWIDPAYGSGSVTETFSNLPVGGQIYYKNNLTGTISPDCYPLNQSRIRIQRTGTDPANPTVVALAINASRGSDGYFNGGGSWVSSNGTLSSYLGYSIPSGKPHFVAVFSVSTSGPAVVGPSRFKMSQQNNYECNE